MPTVELATSPHAPAISPVTIHYRDHGRCSPLMILHGGWGYEVYPFDRQIAAFGEQFRILIPDRSGYGHSTHINEDMPLDFHRRAAAETAALLDALDIRKATLWGHSDGSVIAAMMGLHFPDRCERLILEAFHFLKRKPGSRAFFERFAARPEDLGEETRALLVKDHGEEYWKTVIRRNCAAWFRIADAVQRPDEDLYDGCLGKITPPTLFVHGRLDPRTEPGEMESVRKTFPQAALSFIEGGKHAPHCEEAALDECNQRVREFLAT
jgi:pimeloyl-ACP methyl ester carboxylesterase